MPLLCNLKKNKFEKRFSLVRNAPFSKAFLLAFIKTMYGYKAIFNHILYFWFYCVIHL